MHREVYIHIFYLTLSHSIRIGSSIEKKYSKRNMKSIVVCCIDSGGIKSYRPRPVNKYQTCIARCMYIRSMDKSLSKLFSSYFHSPRFQPTCVTAVTPEKKSRGQKGPIDDFGSCSQRLAGAKIKTRKRTTRIVWRRYPTVWNSIHFLLCVPIFFSRFV